MKTVLTDRSSNIKQVDFDESTNDLFVTFKNGGKYKYSDVPEHLFEEMTKADSVGKYFINNIKTKYQYKKI